MQYFGLTVCSIQLTGHYSTSFRKSYNIMKNQDESYNLNFNLWTQHQKAQILKYSGDLIVGPKLSSVYFFLTCSWELKIQLYFIIQFIYSAKVPIVAHLRGATSGWTRESSDNSLFYLLIFLSAPELNKHRMCWHLQPFLQLSSVHLNSLCRSPLKTYSHCSTTPACLNIHWGVTLVSSSPKSTFLESWIRNNINFSSSFSLAHLEICSHLQRQQSSRESVWGVKFREQICFSECLSDLVCGWIFIFGFIRFKIERSEYSKSNFKYSRGMLPSIHANCFILFKWTYRQSLLDFKEKMLQQQRHSTSSSSRTCCLCWINLMIIFIHTNTISCWWTWVDTRVNLSCHSRNDNH